MSEETLKLDELREEKMSFDEEKHKYTGTVSGDEYISVTTLLKKYGLSPSEYAEIPEAILKAKAAYGSAVHKALEEFIKGDETQLLIPEVAAFNEWLKENSLTVYDCLSEQVHHNEYYKVAGTVDVQIWNIIADFKTTATLHYVPVMWQLSLYNFLLHPEEDKYSMHELRCFWFSSSGTLTVKEIPLVPYNRLISLLDAYKAGEETWVDKTIPSDIYDKADEFIKQERLIKTVKKNLKQLQNEQDIIKGSLVDQMNEEKLIHVESPLGSITVTEVSRTTYDNHKVTEALTAHGLKPADFKNTSTYTKVTGRDKKA